MIQVGRWGWARWGRGGRGESRTLPRLLSSHFFLSSNDICTDIFSLATGCRPTYLHSIFSFPYVERSYTGAWDVSKIIGGEVGAVSLPEGGGLGWRRASSRWTRWNVGALPGPRLVRHLTRVSGTIDTLHDNCSSISDMLFLDLVRF